MDNNNTGRGASMKNTDMSGISAVIVAGGQGTRLGANTPKAFVLLGHKPLFTWSLVTLDKHPAISETVLVIPTMMHAQAEAIVGSLALEKPFVLVAGGTERWESVRNGVMAADDKNNWIVVHDAARPFITEKVIDTLLEKQESFLCAITATPVVDTIRSFDKESCLETLDRSKLLRVGTPQLFYRQKLIEAFDKARAMTLPPTDEAMLMERCGMKVGYAWGDENNFKITTESDLKLAEGLLRVK